MGGEQDRGPRPARLTLDPAFRVGAVRPGLFGSFVEHMGRCVYTGIYEPDHPTADAAGFRGDVVDLARELGVSVVRYPGGNFVSAYRWEDGIGPRPERPVRLDPAWHAVESNQVGVDDFIGWTRTVGAEPMLAVNLGTRGQQEACDLLEYCNHPRGTQLSDLRVKHGWPEPHAVRLWCLGNELDGPWQMGHKTAAEYGRLAAETGRAMKRLDPAVELVACGSSHSGMSTFGAWESTVLEHAYDHVDYLSLHAYYEEVDGDLASFLASAADMDASIDAVVATCDAVRARLRRRRRINLSFDEWNVWYQSRFGGESELDWAEQRPLIEDTYSITDAVVVGSLLITLLQHVDRVSLACQAQLVNVIAPIRTEPTGRAWRQATFHPFAQAARYASGTVLRVEPESPLCETPRYGEVPALVATATHDDERGELVLFAVNRDPHTSLLLRADLRAFGRWQPIEHWVLADADIHACNTADDPTRVVPRTGGGATVDDGILTAELPAVSWHVIRLSKPSDTLY